MTCAGLYRSSLLSPVGGVWRTAAVVLYDMAGDKAGDTVTVYAVRLVKHTA